MLPIFSIDYDEPNPGTYRAVKVSFRGMTVHFETGDPSEDYVAALRALVEVGFPLEEMGFTCSSSVDHFVTDGGTLEMPEVLEV